MLVTGNTVQNAAESNLLAYHLPWLLLEKKISAGTWAWALLYSGIFSGFSFLGCTCVGYYGGSWPVLAVSFSKRDVLSRSFCLMTINGFLFMPRANASTAGQFCMASAILAFLYRNICTGIYIRKDKAKEKPCEKEDGRKMNIAIIIAAGSGHRWDRIFPSNLSMYMTGRFLYIPGKLSETSGN